MKALYQDLCRDGLWLPCKLLDYEMDSKLNADDDIETYAIEYEGDKFGVFDSEIKLMNENQG